MGEYGEMKECERCQLLETVLLELADVAEFSNNTISCSETYKLVKDKIKRSRDIVKNKKLKVIY